MHNNSRVSIIFLLSSAFALIFAYMLEYFFYMLPCKLCIYERVIYYITGLLVVVHMFKSNKILIHAMFFSYFIGIVISFYHIGLELHLFYDILGCTEQAAGSDVSIEELRNKLLNPNYSPFCDRPNYVLGISLATWNFIYLIVALFLSSKTYYKKGNFKVKQ
ncbi:disulfide bond formation protein B [Wolbachia endosymbiont of Dirofilaria (Dirofilaria) immitis]|uniref:disulfide bond formation protein B n=1 Tax=Wolbachia endosymbiont of Dirofilaria (Dirofilaria) immitis TaxID=1812115 RepID=UPI00158C8B24|nr:disulfide bond formation protein B [Wolbachia endosymbiont of Dirofilaria (Dirofilaria) immitis]QKX02119.1 disulfide bond formation protein B [Wolbachia endosymbiont of Dirofilaria (Dirofilaria) immitis]